VNEQDYAFIDQAIDRIHASGPDFLNLEQIAPTKPEFRVFHAILDKALRFSKKIPPVCTHYDESDLDKQMELEDKIWRGLPNEKERAQIETYFCRFVCLAVDVNAQDKNDDTLLIKAIKTNHLDACIAFIRSHPELNEQDKFFPQNFSLNLKFARLDFLL
jgi:predicted dienelactone hydrolase